MVNSVEMHAISEAIFRVIEKLPLTGTPASLALLQQLERECFPENSWTAPQIAASLLSPAFRVILIAGDGHVQEYRTAGRAIDSGGESAQDLDSAAERALTLQPPPPPNVAGYALIQILDGEATCEILRLGIRPEFRRRGLALILLGFLDRINAIFLNHAEIEASGESHLLLEVSADNAAALALYRRHGFEELARRKAYYPARDVSGAPVDAVVLRRTLPAATEDDRDGLAVSQRTSHTGTTYD